MVQSNSVSIFVTSQVPDFMNRDGPELVNFIKSYYDWMGQFENPVLISRKLAEYKDVDFIPEKYLQFIRNEFMKSIPVTLVNDRLLIKNILDFYRARGTEKSYRMLFRILYGDESVSFYYPGKDILRASDGKWVIDRSLKLNLKISLDKIENLIVIRGQTSNATARKDKFLSYVTNDVKTDELFINNLFGTFVIGEQIVNDDTDEIIGIISEFVTYPGTWVGTDGFLSSDKKLEDNFFYQEYSYQIRSSHSLSEYEDIANALVHPSGTKLFGAVDIFAPAHFAINLSLISNVGNVGDISKIVIGYQSDLVENPNIKMTNFNSITETVKVGEETASESITQRDSSDIVDRDGLPILVRGGTSTAALRIGSADDLAEWLNDPISEVADLEVLLFSKNVIFRSNSSAFTIPDWTPVNVVDTINSFQTDMFISRVVNPNIAIFSTAYPHGTTNNVFFTYQVIVSGDGA